MEACKRCEALARENDDLRDALLGLVCDGDESVLPDMRAVIASGSGPQPPDHAAAVASVAAIDALLRIPKRVRSVLDGMVPR